MIDPQMGKLSGMFPDKSPAVTSPRQNVLDAFGVDHPDELLIGVDTSQLRLRNGGLPANRRLEFLGDAVLGLTITDELFRRLLNVRKAISRNCGPALSIRRHWPTSARPDRRRPGRLPAAGAVK